MYSGNEEPVVVPPDTFAARDIQQNGYSSASDDVMEYMRKTNCNFDTLRRINRRKGKPKLFIV